MSYRFDRDPIELRPVALKAVRKLSPERRFYQFIGPYCLTPDAYNRRLTVQDIKVAVCRHYGVSALDLISDRRSRDIAHPRQVAMYLAKARTPRSLPYIGRLFGNRDHTTVIHAVRAVGLRRIADAEFDAKLTALEAKL